MHDHAARCRPAVIIERSDFVIATARVPAEKFIRPGLTEKFLAGEPINLLHVAIDFGPQWNGFSRCEKNLFARGRNDSRTVPDSSGKLASSFRQKRRRKFPRYACLLKQREKFARPEFVNFTAQFARAVVDRNAQTGCFVD